MKPQVPCREAVEGETKEGCKDGVRNQPAPAGGADRGWEETMVLLQQRTVCGVDETVLVTVGGHCFGGLLAACKQVT